MADRVDRNRAQHHRVADEDEHIREIESDSVRGSADDERIGNALRPHDRRNQVAERTAGSGGNGFSLSDNANGFSALGSALTASSSSRLSVAISCDRPT